MKLEENKIETMLPNEISFFCLFLAKMASKHPSTEWQESPVDHNLDGCSPE